MKKSLAFKLNFSNIWDRFSTVFILILMIAVFGSLQPVAFLNAPNMVKIVEQSSITILLACGEFFAILLAGIDLSVSSTMALTGVITAKLMVMGYPPTVAVLLGTVALGIFIGLVNSTLLNLTGLPPFVITLGTQAILRGITVIIADARAVVGIPPEFTLSVGGKLFGVIPMPIIIALVTALILTFFTLKTQAGRNLYAIGGNSLAAWFAGINTKMHVVLAYVISGVCAGLAGMVNIARLGAAEPNAGTGYETFAVAAVVIGGTSFFGGQGLIPKVVLGGIIIGAINNGLNMIGVSSYYQQITMGAMIITTVTLDRFFGASGKLRK